MENLQGAATITSALHYRIRSCQILVTGKQQKRMGAKTRTRSGSGLTIWSGESAKLHDANEKKRYAAMPEDGLKRKLPTLSVSLSGTEFNLRQASKQRAKRGANRTVEQKTADNVREAARQKAAYWAVQNGVRVSKKSAKQRARRASRSVEQKTADNVRERARQKADGWAAQGGMRG
jgi:hypothetical protein